MISEDTLRNVEILHRIGNYIGVMPISAKFKLGIFGNCTLLPKQIIWKVILGVQVLVRIIVSSFVIFQLFDFPEITYEEVAIGLGMLVFLLQSAMLTVFLIFRTRDLVRVLNRFFGLNQHFSRILRIIKFDDDGMSAGTGFILIAIFSGGSFFAILLFVVYQYEAFFLFHGLNQEGDILNSILIPFLMTYVLLSDVLLLATFAFHELIYFQAVYKWLSCIRWRIDLTHADKIRYFHVFRSLEVLNCMWQELRRTQVLAVLFSVALLAILTLFVLIRGGIANYHPVFNIVIAAVALAVSLSLFVGGQIFFYYTLKMETQSKNCWVSDHLTTQNWEIPSSTGLLYDKAFLRSCSPIRAQIGIFLSIKNRSIPIVFYGQIVVTTTINLLLTLA